MHFSEPKISIFSVGGPQTLPPPTLAPILLPSTSKHFPSIFTFLLKPWDPPYQKILDPPLNPQWLPYIPFNFWEFGLFQDKNNVLVNSYRCFHINFEDMPLWLTISFGKCWREPKETAIYHKIFNVLTYDQSKEIHKYCHKMRFQNVEHHRTTTCSLNENETVLSCAKMRPGVPTSFLAKICPWKTERNGQITVHMVNQKSQNILAVTHKDQHEISMPSPLSNAISNSW